MKHLIDRWRSVPVVAVVVVVTTLLLFLAQNRPSSVPEKEGSPSPTTEVSETALVSPESENGTAYWQRLKSNVLDSKDDRGSKAFQRRMMTLGTSPLEIVDGDHSSLSGIQLGLSPNDIKEFVDSGGHYSGPQTMSPERAQGKKR